MGLPIALLAASFFGGAALGRRGGGSEQAPPSLMTSQLKPQSKPAATAKSKPSTMGGTLITGGLGTLPAENRGTKTLLGY
jgi:hypothetical protein